MSLNLEDALTQEEITTIESYLSKLASPHFFTRLIRFFLSHAINLGMYIYTPLTIRGLEHINTQEPLIICANHTSLLDGIIIGVAAFRIQRQVVGLTAVKYMHSTFLKLLTDFLPFDQRITKKALAKNLKYLLLARRQNKIFILFPEGTRSADNTLQAFKSATAWIAEKAKLNIVPAYISGAYESLPKGAFFPKPRKLIITFGTAITVPAKDDDLIADSSHAFYADLTDQIRQSILNLKERG